MEYGYALQMNQSHMKYMKDEGKKCKKIKTNNGKYTENMFFFCAMMHYLLLLDKGKYSVAMLAMRMKYSSPRQIGQPIMLCQSS